MNTGTSKSGFLRYLTKELTPAIYKALGAPTPDRARMPKYKGLYIPYNPSPRKSREWVYFTITGISNCEPCFGWEAKGGEYLLSDLVFFAFLMYALLDRKELSVSGEEPRTYIGISLGKPTWNFGGTRGKPSYDVESTDETLKLTTALQKEWTMLLAEFRSHFMVPHVAFTLGIGGASFESTGEAQDMSGLTEVINEALDRGSRDPITYHGVSHPVVVDRQWVFFTFITLAHLCTKDDPCFGWIAQGCEYLLLNLVFFAILMYALLDDFQSHHGDVRRHYAQRYAGIVKWGKAREDGARGFTVVARFPRTIEKAHVAAALGVHPQPVTPSMEEKDWLRIWGEAKANGPPDFTNAGKFPTLRVHPQLVTPSMQEEEQLRIMQGQEWQHIMAEYLTKRREDVLGHLKVSDLETYLSNLHKINGGMG